ncbi:ABC transporter ATP-binding protein [Halorubellus litoreus]|uniref:Energy-coupling factor ABC transporter ATP-binding protein n=1 Tax=Halorubellus litoreus TaxID=755308 RepID=A0ABD5VKF7_9EURY
MIVVDDVSYAHGDTRVLDDVSLSIEDGEFVVLAGANGAGKTTLVRQFNGLLEPDTGEVLVNGTPVEADLVAARSAVGMVFQDPRDQFVAATVDADVAFGPENLGVSREAVSTRVEDALAAVGMTGRGEERLDELSGGEQSRVAIAGALAMTPDHLVLDEPFASLDAPSREAVREHLADLHADGTSVVVVTHDVGAIADLADRVVVLADGRVVREGSPTDLRGELDEHAVAAW